jgi:2-polyprenyl-3-methyl-5-hydroxy-6-metoxy-1,4-benzoquinol methylase
MNKETKQKLLNIVRQNYEDIADDFSETRNYVWPELEKIIDSVIASRRRSNPEVYIENNGIAALCHPRRLARNDKLKILDLGCGNGRLAELFSGRGAEYTGIEQSAKLANLAETKIKQLQFADAQIITGDILNLDKITGKKFDLILCVAVLPHIPSMELRAQFLQQIKNHLAPGDVLILTAWNLRAQGKYKKIIWKQNFLKIFGLNKMDFGDIVFSGFNQKSKRYYHAFKKQKLQTLLLQSGFNIREFYADKHNIYAICAV